MSGYVSYAFVGDKPSNKALQMGVTWYDGKLAAAQLFDALRFCGIDPDSCRFENINHCDETGKIAIVRSLRKSRRTIVAMGENAASELKRLGCPHIQIVHPAARGRIRKKERYCAHVREVLGVSS